MTAEYNYRRRLGLAELLPAIAVGLGAGLAGFYLARVMAEKTPLVPRSDGTKSIARSEPPQPPRAAIKPAAR